VTFVTDSVEDPIGVHDVHDTSDSQDAQLHKSKKEGHDTKEAWVWLAIAVNDADDQAQNDFNRQQAGVNDVEVARSRWEIRGDEIVDDFNQSSKRFRHGGCCANRDGQVVPNFSLEEKKKLKLIEKNELVKTNFRVTISKKKLLPDERETRL